MSHGQLKLFSGSAHPALAKEIAEHLGIPLGAARLHRFPDSEVSFQIDENIRGTDVFIVQPTCAPVDQHLIELCVMIDAFRRSSASRITAVIPYYGYARQDRKDKPRVPISAKLVANLLSAAGTNRVLTMDLHKAQIQGFFDIPVDHLFAAPVIIEYLARQDFDGLTIVSPDAGGAERARAYAKRLDAELAIIDKRRSEDGTAEVMNVVGDVKGRVCVIADDIIDTAGTIQKAAQALKDNGASRVLASAVHGVLSGPAIKRIENSPIDKLVVTNTIPPHGAWRMRQGRGAVGGAAAGAGHSQHSRRDVGLEVVRVEPENLRTEVMEATLEAVRRETIRPNEAGRIRREGQIPAVVYGGASEAEPVSVDPKALLQILHSRVRRQHADLAEARRRAATRRCWSRNTSSIRSKHELLHADFYRVAMDKVLRVTVPVHLTGEAKGVKAAGRHRRLRASRGRGRVPAGATFRSTSRSTSRELMLHDGIRVRDLPTGGKWKAVSEPTC